MTPRTTIRISLDSCLPKHELRPTGSRSTRESREDREGYLQAHTDVRKPFVMNRASTLRR